MMLSAMPVNRSAVWICIIVITFMAVLASLLFTFVSGGISLVFLDSIHYVAMARSLLNGHGLTMPSFIGNKVVYAQVTHWPPLYPALLAVLSPEAVDPFQVAGLLNSVLYGLNIFVLGISAGYVLQWRVKWAALASVFMAASITVLVVHSWAWTEGLFILWVQISLLLLARFLYNPRWQMLVIGAVVVGFACLARYAGASLVALILICVYWKRRSNPLRAAGEGLLILIISFVPTAAWMIQDSVLDGILAPRGIAFHPPDMAHVLQGLFTISDWLLPRSTSQNLPVILLESVLVILILYAVFRAVLQRASVIEESRSILTTLAPSIRGYLTILLLFVGVYGGFVLMSRTVLDAQISLDMRILSPIFPPILVLCLFVVKALYDAVKGNRYLKNLIHLAVACGLSLYIAAAHYWASSQPLLQASQENLPISSIFREMDKLPGDALIFSNCFDCVYFWGGHISREIPFWLNPYTLEQRDTEGQFEQYSRELAENHGYLVWIDDVHREHLVPEAELLARLPVRLKVRVANGSIYEIDDLAFQFAPESNEQVGN